MSKSFILRVEVLENGSPESHFEAGFGTGRLLMGGMKDLLELFALQGVEPALAFLFEHAKGIPGVTTEDIELPQSK